MNKQFKEVNEILKEDIKRWKQEKKSQKLDFNTWLFLYITRAVRVKHLPVQEVDNKKTMALKESKYNEVFVFKDYEEYRNYFLMFLDNIDDSLIDLAIYTRGSKGQVVALKGLCERIIIKKRMKDFFTSITQEQIDEIHSKGKLTPLEIVQLWESNHICIEGTKSLISLVRCKYFEGDCHECLMEVASHNLEYDPTEFKIPNTADDENEYLRKISKK